MTPLDPGQLSGLSDWAQWCFATCLLFGADPSTAARVAAHFADAIQAGRRTA